MHHITYAPKTVIGTATPVSPPGTVPTNTTIPTYHPGDPATKTHKQPTTAKKAVPVTVTKKGVARTDRSQAVKVIMTSRNPPSSPKHGRS